MEILKGLAVIVAILLVLCIFAEWSGQGMD